MSQSHEIRTTIEAAVGRVLADKGLSPRPIADNDALFGQIGLDSLDLAQVVVALEQELGVDPYRQVGRPLRTFGDLVQAYSEQLERTA